MTTIIKCDKCGETGDSHPRHIEITTPEPHQSMPDYQPEIDLCGHCFAHFRQWMKATT